MLLALLLVGAAALAARFLARPIKNRARALEHFSGVWTLSVYLCLGLVPLLWKLRDKWT